jgi:hypothetical protein
MKILFTLGLMAALPLLCSQNARADDDLAELQEEEQVELLEEGGNDLGHGSCAAFEDAVQTYKACIKRARAGGGTRTGIYKCGKRPKVPARCG